MVKRRNSKEKVIEETDEETVILLSSSDDEEANEDLTLEIVEKARQRKAKEKVIDLSSGEDANTQLFVIPELKKKKKRKKKNKKNKKINKIVDADVEEPMGIVTSVEGETEPLVVVKSGEVGGEITKQAGDDVEAVEVLENNIVLRKLLRGPRYFDPQDKSWGACYNCGEEGHNAVNCTAKKRKKPCFICGSFDHGIRNCTQGQDCFICKKRGHRAKCCPEKHQENLRENKICLRCGDQGHLMSTCSKDYDLGDLKDIQCYVCKRLGHLCCVDSIDPGPREVSCYNCGQSDHIGAGCAKQRGEVSGAPPATLCYKCGEEGHFARGCTSFSKPDRWMAESSSPTQKNSKKGRHSSGFQSAPPDLNKNHKKKSIEYEERDFANGGRSNRKGRWIMDDPGEQERDFETGGRSKQRGGWIPDDLGDRPKRKATDSGWRSPSTSTKKAHRNTDLNIGGLNSNSQSPWKSHNHIRRTPISHVPNYHATPLNYNSTPRTPISHVSAYPRVPITPNSHSSAYPHFPMTQGSGSAYPHIPRTPNSHGSAYPHTPMTPNSHGSAYPHIPMTPNSHGSAYPHIPMTPNSHGSANSYQHMYTPSRFGNSIGSGSRSYDW